MACSPHLRPSHWFTTVSVAQCPASPPQLGGIHSSSATVMMPRDTWTWRHLCTHSCAHMRVLLSTHTVYTAAVGSMLQASVLLLIPIVALVPRGLFLLLSALVKCFVRKFIQVILHNPPYLTSALSAVSCTAT